MIVFIFFIKEGRTHEEIQARNELREGYGILFNYQGELYHGLNPYWLVLGYELPKLYYKTDTQWLDMDLCEQVNKMNGTNVLFEMTCKEMWGQVMRNAERGLALQQELDYLVGSELPSVIPSFNPGDVGWI